MAEQIFLTCALVLTALITLAAGKPGNDLPDLFLDLCALAAFISWSVGIVSGLMWIWG